MPDHLRHYKNYWPSGALHQPFRRTRLSWHPSPRQAELRLTVEELGFRYIRFGISKTFLYRPVADGETTYDETGIDTLYDHLLALPIRRGT